MGIFTLSQANIERIKKDSLELKELYIQYNLLAQVSNYFVTIMQMHTLSDAIEKLTPDSKEYDDAKKNLDSLKKGMSNQVHQSYSKVIERIENNGKEYIFTDTTPFISRMNPLQIQGELKRLGLKPMPHTFVKNFKPSADRYENLASSLAELVFAPAMRTYRASTTEKLYMRSLMGGISAGITLLAINMLPTPYVEIAATCLAVQIVLLMGAYSKHRQAERLMDKYGRDNYSAANNEISLLNAGVANIKLPNALEVGKEMKDKANNGVVSTATKSTVIVKPEAQKVDGNTMTLEQKIKTVFNPFC